LPGSHHTINRCENICTAGCGGSMNGGQWASRPILRSLAFVCALEGTFLEAEDERRRGGSPAREGRLSGQVVSRLPH
jgi:hypothetical protein